MELYIKICPNPHCEAIYHNIQKKVTKCIDCNFNIIIINKKTYYKKFYNYFFQYDYNTMNLYRPQKSIQLQINF